MKILIVGPTNYHPWWQAREVLSQFDMRETVVVHADRPGVDRVADAVTLELGGSVVRWTCGSFLADHADADLLLLFARSERDAEKFASGGLPFRVVTPEPVA